MKLAPDPSAKCDAVDVGLNFSYTAPGDCKAARNHKVFVLAACVAEKAHRWQIGVRYDKSHA